MNKKDVSNVSDLICYHFVEPVKESGVDSDQIAQNAMIFIQDLCKKYPSIAEQISFCETNSNRVAGVEFLDELNIKHT